MVLGPKGTWGFAPGNIERSAVQNLDSLVSPWLCRRVLRSLVVVVIPSDVGSNWSPSGKMLCCWNWPWWPVYEWAVVLGPCLWLACSVTQHELTPEEQRFREQAGARQAVQPFITVYLFFLEPYNTTVNHFMSSPLRLSVHSETSRCRLSVRWSVRRHLWSAKRVKLSGDLITADGTSLDDNHSAGN